MRTQEEPVFNEAPSAILGTTTFRVEGIAIIALALALVLIAIAVVVVVRLVTVVPSERTFDGAARTPRARTALRPLALRSLR
jgi:hypothetical protein